MFMFLPIVLGYTSAKKFGLNPFIGLAIGMALCYGFTTEGPMGQILGIDYHLKFMSIPFIVNDYTSSVVPVLIITWLASKIEKLAKRFVPDMLKTFFVPFFTLLITLPIGFLLIGPIVAALTNILGAGFTWLANNAPIVLGVTVGFVWMVLVIFGLHWSLVPLMLINIGTIGYDNIQAAIFGHSFAMAAVLLAVYMKTRDHSLRGACMPAAVSALFGVTEPGIYGIALPKKKPFYFALIGSAVGGLIISLMNVRAYTSGGLGIFMTLSFINTATGDTSGVWGAIIAAVASAAVGFLLTYFLWSDEKKPAADEGESCDIGATA
jgi:PTS system beta-glucosides-specific IIC component